MSFTDKLKAKQAAQIDPSAVLADLSKPHPNALPHLSNGSVIVNEDGSLPKVTAEQFHPPIPAITFDEESLEENSYHMHTQRMLILSSGKKVLPNKLGVLVPSSEEEQELCEYYAAKGLITKLK